MTRMTPRAIARRLRRPQRGPSEGRTAAAAAALRERLRGGPPRLPKPQRLAYGNDVLMDNPPAVRRSRSGPRVAHKDLDNPPRAIEVQPSRGVAHIPTGATADHSIKRTNPSKQPRHSTHSFIATAPVTRDHGRGVPRDVSPERQRLDGGAGDARAQARDDARSDRQRRARPVSARGADALNGSAVALARGAAPPTDGRVAPNPQPRPRPVQGRPVLASEDLVALPPLRARRQATPHERTSLAGMPGVRAAAAIAATIERNRRAEVRRNGRSRWCARTC